MEMVGTIRRLGLEVVYSTFQSPSLPVPIHVHGSSGCVLRLCLSAHGDVSL